MFLPSNITLKFGDSGDFVAELQRRLSLVHCFSKDQINGFYDGPTVAGVTQFQAMNGLHADGVAGPETLRRLNGVIAGGSGDTADTKNEEEEAKRLADAQLTNLALAQSQPDPTLGWVMPGAPQAAQEAAPAQAEAAPAIPTFYAADQQPAPISQLPPISPVDMADIARQQAQQQAPSNDLASMLLSPQPTQPAPLPPELSDRALAAQQAQAQSSIQPKLAPQPQQLQAAREPRVEPRVEPQVQPEPQGLIQKTMRFASAMMQRLSDYFEAKLPPSVLREVQSIGVVMAAGGLREAPIPTGPELARPEQTPARGPEQQPAQTR